MTDGYAEVAGAAVERAGAYLRERFEAGSLDADFRAGDVTTRADHEAEARVVERIRETYPDHAIAAEESGDHDGRADRRWVVDALDGTNNFAAGIPTFGVAATLVDGRGSLVTAVGVPVTGDLYLARRDGGVTYNGRRVAATDGPSPPPAHATVACVLGERVLESPDLTAEYEALVGDLSHVPKRVVRSWAPVVHWGLLARGRIGGFVCFHPDEREQAAGRLLAREAACVERTDGALSVFARDGATCGTLWDALGRD